ncbi:MAG TPA: pyridoxal phosphate-dependent aminotransferase [Gemmatimonadaceae bacterium]|nr:pyridoxal phosphate-dependent aminotransferase [Gemmatimonadaceae bacterium]
MTVLTSRPFTPSKNIAELKESATIKVSTRAKALRALGRNIIDLGVGEPDMQTPAYVMEAAVRAIEAGVVSKYTATEGIPPLREAIAWQANALLAGDDRIDAADVVVSTGSKQSLFNACFVLFGSGDDVLIPTPSWTSYYEMVKLARATPVPVYGDASRGFLVTAAMLEAAATPRTRGVMINSPCNPTGAVYSRAELEDIVRLAEERGWWLISDEIYRQLAYDGPATSALELVESRERLILVDGVAKTYAMTGWRIGWAIAPRDVARAMTALQSHSTSNPAAVSQHAALAALTDRAASDAWIASMVAELRWRREEVLRIVRTEPRLSFVVPDGAFYLFAHAGLDQRGASAPGDVLAEHLLEKHDVAVVPGAAFLTPEWVRVSYAAPRAQLTDGFHRLVRAVRELTP